MSRSKSLPLFLLAAAVLLVGCGRQPSPAPTAPTAVSPISESAADTAVSQPLVIEPGDTYNPDINMIVDHEGAWLTGEDNAKPGIWALANPQAGDRFRNEYRQGEAEDETEVLSVHQTVTVPYGTFTDCIKNLDGSPLFAAKAHAYLCKGVGTEVLGVDLAGPETAEEQLVELVEIDPTGAIGIELPGAYASEGVKDVIPFSDVIPSIEFNAVAGDLGFHAELDSEPFHQITVFGPNGDLIFDIGAQGSVATQGLTAFTFESAEPSLAELPREKFMARFPEGEYVFTGLTIEGEVLTGVAEFSHTIPNPPVIVSPAEGEVVDREAVVIAWEPVTGPTGIEVAVYQLQVFPVDPPEGQDPIELNIDLLFEVPPFITEVRISPELLEPGAEYQYELGVIEEGGNRTLAGGIFVTAP